MLYINVSLLNDKVVALSFNDGWDHSPKAKLTGSTFSVVPIGTNIENLSVNFPDGLQALSISYRIDIPRRKGSGHTAYLDHSVEEGTVLLLSWHASNKIFVKKDSDLSPSELTKFNRFVRTSDGVLVTDLEHKVAYVSGLPSLKTIDPAWTYKSVSMDAILAYIVKRITLEELDARATSEQQSRDELAELRVQTRTQYGSIESLQTKANRLEAERERLADDLTRSQQTIRDIVEENNKKVLRLVNALDGHWWPWVNVPKLIRLIGQIFV